MTIKVILEDFAPSEGKLSYVPESIRARIGERDWESSIRIVKLREPAYYNRVDYDPEKALERTEDGILVINSPNIFAGEKRETKGGSNAFFPAGSVIVAINVKHSDLGSVDASKLLHFAQGEAYKIVRKRSSIRDVQKVNNDILFKGRKFYGEEVAGFEDCYSITGIVTCEYKKYEAEFQRLRGLGIRPITGITDEIPELTRDIIAQELFEAALALTEEV